MSFADRETLLRKAPKRYAVVPTQLGDVRIQSLSEMERSQYEASITDKNGEVTKKTVMTIRPKLISLCVVDADGQRVFSDADVPAIAEMDGAVTGKLFAACKELCGFEQADLEAAIKNSGDTLGD